MSTYDDRRTPETVEIEHSKIEKVAEFLHGITYDTCIDVGAKDGYLATILHNCTSIDPRPVHDSVFEGTSAGVHGRFDLAIYNHVLEHIEDPHAELRRVARFARAVFIAVPDAQAQDTTWVNGEDDNDPHLHLFSDVTLRRVLERAGFEVQTIRSAELSPGRKELWAVASVQKTIAVDMDGVLCEDDGDWTTYATRTPLNENIRRVNALHGRKVIYTARLEQDREVTEKWLQQHGVQYNDLVLGKLVYDYIIDDRSVALSLLPHAL